MTVEPRLVVSDGYSGTLSSDRIEIPGGGDAEVVVTVTRSAGTATAGSLRLELPDDSRQLRQEPTDNWVRVATLSASSTHAPSSVTTLNDGDTNSERWGAGGANGWNDGTPQVFPDHVQADWDQPVSLSRVQVYTLDSAAYPAAQWGVRDYDVQVRADGAWQTVAAVRGNTRGIVASRFPAVTTRDPRWVAR